MAVQPPQTAEEFDARFDAGEDMGVFLRDPETPREIEVAKAIASAVPDSLMVRIEAAARARGVSRTELIDRWLREKLDEAA